jgi:broad specificity phosphatase PhoE
MNNQREDFEDILKGIDAALRRAAQTAKKLAEQNGTPYVVTENDSIDKLQSSDVA